MPDKSILRTGLVTIVILNYKAPEDTIKCLESIEEQNYSKYNVIVVENGSNDNSSHELTEYAKQSPLSIEIINNSHNLGFAGGVNIGIKRAMELSSDYVALFNNDAVADKSWLKELVSAIESDEEIGFSTGLLLDVRGEKIDSAGEQYSTWGLSFSTYRGMKTEQAPGSRYIFGATGGAVLYRTALFQDIGMFDEDFFAYYEDVDISFRAQLAGWKSIYTPSAVAYHKHGATSSKMPGFTVYQTFKNLPLLFIKDVPFKLFVSIGSRFYLAYVLMYLKTFTQGSVWPATKGVLKSFALGLKKFFIERPVIQKNKRVSSDYIRSIMWQDLPPEQTGLRKFRKIFTGK